MRLPVACTRTLPLLFSAVAALFGACSGETVHLHGRLLHADGTPAANLRVSAYELDDSTTTDAEGRYELSGSRSGTSDHAYVSVRRSETELFDTLQIAAAIDSDDLAVPDVHLWDDALVLSSTSGGGAHLEWKAPPESFTLVSAYVLQGPAGQRGEISWEASHVTGTSLDLAPEVMEERLSTFILIAGDGDETSGCTRALCVTAFSRPAYALQPGTRVPLSRGRTCTALATDGSSTRLGDGGVCPLTDGIVGWYPPYLSPEPQAVTIDLGAPTLVQRILVHDVTTFDGAGWTLSIAPENGNFTEVARVAMSNGHDYVDTGLDAPATVRFIRIVGASGSTLEAISEVSVF
jgi:hypothetical protein